MDVAGQAIVGRIQPLLCVCVCVCVEGGGRVEGRQIFASNYDN